MNSNCSQNERCRTCLKTHINLKLLSTKPKGLKISKTYMDLLKSVANVDIDADDDIGSSSPMGICCTCCKRLRDSYTFIKQVRNCNKQFRKVLGDTQEIPDSTDLDANEGQVEEYEFPPLINKEMEEFISLPLKEKTEPHLSSSSSSDKFDEGQVDECDFPPLIKEEMEEFIYLPLKEKTGQDLSSSSSSYNYDEGQVDECDFSPLIKKEMEEFISLSLKEKTGQDLSSSSSSDNFDKCSPPDLSDSHMQQGESEDLSSLNNLGVPSELTDSLDDLHPSSIPNDYAYNERENTNASSDTCKNVDNNTYDPLDSNGINEDEQNKEPAVSIDEKILLVRCDECERVFLNSMQLNRHKKETHMSDEIKIQCPHCSVKFRRRNNMYAHMRTFHKAENIREHQLKPRKLAKTVKEPNSKPKRHLCTVCGLTFSCQSNLDIHYRRHNGEKPFKCDFCNRAFSSIYDMQVHRYIHTGEAPFKCTVCEKAFKRSNKLQIHMRTHTNERPYKCTQCEKAFKQSKDIKIHMRTHTGERPYQCTVCNSLFTQSSSLRLHQTKTKHHQVINNKDITNTLS